MKGVKKPLGKMKKILLIAGTHGVEPQSRDFAVNFQREISIFPKQLLTQIFIIPDLNPYGLKHNTRGNKNGVDLNRNMPAKNWCASEKMIIKHGQNAPTPNPYYSGPAPASEEETQKLVQIILNGDFDLIISLHTNHFMENPNPPQINYDGETVNLRTADDVSELGNKYADGYKFACDLSKSMQLPLTIDIGYPTPGSLGSYCKDIGVPCVTVEFEDELSSDALWEKYSKVFIDGIHIYLSK